MLAIFTRILDAAFMLGLGTIAHVLILARTFRNAHLVTRTAVEAGGSIGIGGVAYLILSTAIDAAPSVVTVGSSQPALAKSGYLSTNSGWAAVRECSAA